YATRFRSADARLDDDELEPSESAPGIVAYSAQHDLYERPIPADLVALVVEVVSPSTKRKDRRIQPTFYAEAQIRHYWRVETDQAAPAVATDTEEADGAPGEYGAAGGHHAGRPATGPLDPGLR